MALTISWVKSQKIKERNTGQKQMTREDEKPYNKGENMTINVTNKCRKRETKQVEN